jgi:hypothetical protein
MCDDDAPLYYVKRNDDDPNCWSVIGPNGVVDTYRVEAEAQSRANQLNESVAEEQEDDY